MRVIKDWVRSYCWVDELSAAIGISIAALLFGFFATIGYELAEALYWTVVGWV
jgi:hypothetical protein